MCVFGYGLLFCLFSFTFPVSPACAVHASSQEFIHFTASASVFPIPLSKQQAQPPCLLCCCLLSWWKSTWCPDRDINVNPWGTRRTEPGSNLLITLFARLLLIFLTNRSYGEWVFFFQFIERTFCSLKLTKKHWHPKQNHFLVSFFPTKTKVNLLLSHVSSQVSILSSPKEINCQIPPDRQLFLPQWVFSSS